MMFDNIKPENMEMIKKNLVIIFYIIQVLFICMYIETDVQPFVYVRF